MQPEKEHRLRLPGGRPGCRMGGRIISLIPGFFHIFIIASSLLHRLYMIERIFDGVQPVEAFKKVRALVAGIGDGGGNGAGWRAGGRQGRCYGIVIPGIVLHCVTFRIIGGGRDD